MAEAEYIGGFSVGGAVPLAAVAVGAAEATLATSLPDAQARLAGAVQAGISVSAFPPSAAATASFGAAALAGLTAAITAPTVGVNAAAAASIIAEFGAIVAALEAQASIIAQLTGILSTAGVHMYEVEGAIGLHGSALQGVLAGGVPGGTADQLGTGFYLVAADNGTIAALRSLFAA